MGNERTRVKIKGRTIDISADGLRSLDIYLIAKVVEERIAEIEKESGVSDCSKLALMAALGYAIELYSVRENLGKVNEAS